EPCPSQTKADIIFVIDSSDSITDHHYIKALSFLAQLVDDFQFGDEDVLFGMVIYSWSVQKIFDLNTFNNTEDIKKAILAAPHFKSSTLTHKAFDFVNQNNMFGTEHGGRDNATDILVLMTDGKSGYKDL
ncbi:unnamed protein product, partial [Candidula unifasciata]